MTEPPEQRSTVQQPAHTHRETTRELNCVLSHHDALPPLEQFSDRTIFQTQPWINFVASCQRAEPVYAAVREGSRVVGRFTGLVVRKFGVRILGSPMPGWTTSYMGFNLEPSVSRTAALVALERFAFRTLKCMHFEIMDRRFHAPDIIHANFVFKTQRGYEIDLSRTSEALFRAMDPACRRCIRKAEKSGVHLEIATDESFADDYYSQLQDVFAKQHLVPTYSLERVRGLIRHLLPTGNLLLVRAISREGKCIATGIFPAYHDTMFFWGGASWRAHQDVRPNEAVQWFAMQYWKDRRITRYDMVGMADYKRKYGGYEIQVPWVRQSRYQALEYFRNTAKRAFSMVQHLRGLRTP
jgi:hypothetical protein